MKYMKQFAIILAVTCVGEILKYFIPLPIPASIYGLVIMLALLISGLVKLDDVNDVATFLIEIMPMMFIPAGVGLMTAWSKLQPVLLPILFITFATTVLVMLVTGKVTDALTAGQAVPDERLEAAEKELARIEKEEVRLKEEIAGAKKKAGDDCNSGGEA
uniref:CidA/LrgA family protein n=1 Tax=Eubacterium cellulosolvens TaxID=29322 RepID=UPI0004820CE0